MSQNDLLRLSNTHLKVSEIFASIQGEGPGTGEPVVFVRLSLCNLHCTFCDTPYTWLWNGTKFKHDTKDYEKSKYSPENEIKEMTTPQIYHQVIELAGDHIEKVVLTGGEPLVQQKSMAFIDMLDDFVNNLGMKVEIETNGTIIPSPEVIPYISQFNVSPKLASSGNSFNLRYKDKAYKFYSSRPDSIFKFVVAGPEDITEIKDIVSMYKIHSNRVFLMPEGRTEEEIKSRAHELVSMCLEHGYIFCNRLQVWIWDPSIRGV